MKNSISIKMPYPENLITEIGLPLIFGEDKFRDLTADQIKGLEHALGTIKERESLLITCRYRDGMTYKQAGQVIDRCGTRAQQLIRQGIRKLRHPERICYIIEGYDGYTERMERLRIKRCSVVKRQSMSPEEIRSALGDEADMSVADMGFTVRTRNCIMRSGINTVYELVMAVFETPDRVFRIVNMGKQSIVEMLEKLKDFGVEIPEDYNSVYEGHSRHTREYVYYGNSERRWPRNGYVVENGL